MRDLRFAGGEKCVVSIINNLDRNKFIPVLGVFNCEGSLKNDLCSDLILHVAGKGLGGCLKFLTDFKYFYNFLQKIISIESPDIIFCSNWIASLVAGYFLRRNRNVPKLVVVSHTPLSKVICKSTLFNIFVPIKLALARILVSRADVAIALNTKMREDFIKLAGMEESRVTIIHNGIDTEEVLRLGCQTFKKNESQPPYIVSVGRLSPEKGHETLVYAFAKIANLIGHNLMIIGEGDKRSCLEDIIIKRDLTKRISLPGVKHNPLPEIKQADFFVLPSYWDTFPYVLLEALTLETPIISSDCDGPREILDNGYYGLLVQPGNVQALADAILKFATEEKLKNDFRSKSLFRAREFAFNRMIFEYEKLLDSL
jgi:glycosyltransferase involved in cell wall biosynthesis